jgi:hypothetical protein
MRRGLGALVGLVVGAGLAFGIGIGLPEVIPINQAEGADMMSVFFFWVPAAALAGAVIGAISSGRR